MSSFESQRPTAAMTFVDGGRQARFMRHEEKQQNLSRFCGTYLDRLSINDGATAAERRITLLARSPQSPVARAVLESQSEIAALGATVRVMFTKLDPAESFAAWLDFAEAGLEERSAVEIRWARRPALVDAHEQLVLGTALSWAGDCMRREPEKRDAYEQFDPFDAAAAALATASFDRFWSLSERVYSRRAMPAEFAATPHAVLTAGTGPVAGTRH